MGMERKEGRQCVGYIKFKLASPYIIFCPVLDGDANELFRYEF